MKSIAVIPARGGSKGIPRKSIRPVAGKPMIFYAIHACLSSSSISKVVVSTDDEEIALLSERFGATVIFRDTTLATDDVTLDPVIFHAVRGIEERFNEIYTHVFTIQPTSPLIQSHDIDRAAELFKSELEEIDTVLTVVDDRHLCWTEEGGSFVPVYHSRVNRQQLPVNFRETGAIIACSRAQLSTGMRIGENVKLLEMPSIRSFDIDNFSDLYLCESILNRKRIVFTVVGYPAVGLGHAFRAVMLAHELVNYDVSFLCEEKSELAAEYIRSFNYQVEVCSDGDFINSIKSIEPDLVINDILDTELKYMSELKGLGCKVVNFEDLGKGAEHADLIINALYPYQEEKGEKYLIGEKYFCLREEFLYPPKNEKKISDRLEVLITFGGIDEGDLTHRVVKFLSEAFEDLEITVITGPGYAYSQKLEEFISNLSPENINWVKNTKRISDYMFRSDFAITSAGRTVLELASTKTPTIAICQNQRELTHTFASEENGVVNLGSREGLTDEKLFSCVKRFLDEKERNLAVQKMLLLDLAKGKERVINKIKSLVI